MTIIFRVIVGVVCDVLGARRGLAFLLFLACPGILGMMSAAEHEWMASAQRRSSICNNPCPDRAAGGTVSFMELAGSTLAFEYMSSHAHILEPRRTDVPGSLRK